MGHIVNPSPYLETIGAKTDTAVTDPTLSASEVALLKGLLKQMQGNGTGATPVQLSGSNVEDITFHDAATVAADGTIFTVAGYKTLTVEIYGTSTTRTIAFVGRGASGEDRALSGVNLNGLSVANSTTSSGEIWQFDIAGLTSVFMDLQAVAGGNVSVKGKAVA